MPDGRCAVAPRRRTRCASACGSCATPAWRPSRSACSTRIVNPAHEQRIKEILLEEMPDTYLSVSHEVLPALPGVRALLDGVPERVRRPEGRALRGSIRPGAARARASGTRSRMMQSSGGTATVDSATERPVNLLMSGPVAGLIGGIWAGKAAGFENVVTLDMGGTSADIGVAAGGGLRMRHLPRHEDRRLPGDGAHGRHRHHRRRGWLDCTRRPGRRLPRRAGIGRRRPGPGVLRPRRHRADLDRRPARPGSATAGPRVFSAERWPLDSELRGAGRWQPLPRGWR